MQNWINFPKTMVFLPLSLCLIWFFIIQNNQPEAHLSPDSQEYLYLAHNIVHHQEFSMGKHGTESFIPDLSRTPIYPLFLSPFLLLPSHWQIQAIILTQIILFGFTIVLFHKSMGLLNFDARTNKWTTTLFGISPVFIVFTNEVLSESLYIFLLVCGFYYFLKYLKFKKPVFLISAAILIGLSVLCRPIGLGIVGVGLLILLIRKEFIRLLLYLTFVAITISPWIIRNYNLTGSPMLSTKLSTSLLYQTARKIENINNNTSIDYKFNASLDWSDPKSHLIFEEYAFESAFEVISNHPKSFLQIVITNLFKFFGQPMKAQIKKHSNWNTPMVYVIIILQVIYLLALYTLIFFGIRNRKRRALILSMILCILYFAIVSSPFEVNARFRIPAMIFMLTMAGIGISNLQGKIHLNRRSFRSSE
ncbi:MAG: glycosyltransferase family 39 protein [Flavobacteriales bacterium]|nr:glycosyltransferase family 39 protein [Flavobacteriales bacterium]